MTKKELRKKYLNIRNSITAEEVIARSSSIIEKLLDSEWYAQANVIMTFINFNKEVITKEFITYALKHDKRIVVPITDMESKNLLLSEITDINNELEPSTFGVLEPRLEYRRLIEDEIIDLVLVPGLVFAVNGYRIGYGGGYYDKLLERFEHKPTAIGLAYDFQIIDSIPKDVFDQKVDHIITDERII